MAAPNPLYVVGPDLQMYFVDKDTGAPLAGGVVTFYEQDNQTVLKPIFELSDAAPNGFIQLNNPITLTSVGTFADNNGNDIIPYFYPYDAAGNPELYFVTVYSAGGVLQFTREDWPPNFAGSSTPSVQNEIVNYVANGQFLLHNDHPVTATVVTNESDLVSYIAQGGWTFEQESTFTSIDKISFIRELTASVNPNVDANPRYFFQISTNGTDTNYSRKDLCLTFPDVNKFAGDPTIASSTYTLSFQGLALSGGSPPVDIRLRKNFGTGGSASTDISLGTIQILPIESVYNKTFTFGENTGDNVGTTLDDDFLQICIRFPNSAQTIDLTDFVLNAGSAPVTAFPQTPNFDFIADSTIGYLPTPLADGSDLGVPVVITDRGSYYDFSRVGQIITTLYSKAYAANFPVLLCDGSIYVSSAYSPLGIPYSRLSNMLIANGGIANTPMFGTGPTFVTAAADTATEFYLNINTAGVGTNVLTGTSTFTIGGSEPNFTVSVGAVPTSALYFQFISNSGTTGAPVLVNHYVWYNTGSSVDPAPGGTGIEVMVTGSDTTTTITAKTLIAINSYQFQLPALGGFFLRGLDTTATVDPDAATRTIAAIGLTGAYLGSQEAQAFLSHTHTYNEFETPAGTVLQGGGTYAANEVPVQTGATGGSETRPVNFAINYFIYY